MSKEEEVIKITCDMFGISTKNFYSESRKDGLPKIRFVAMLVMKELLKMSSPAIGRTIKPDNPLDHSSVLYGINSLKNDFETGDKVTEDTYKQIYSRAHKEVNAGSRLIVYFDNGVDMHEVIRKISKQEGVNYEFI